MNRRAFMAALAGAAVAPKATKKPLYINWAVYEGATWTMVASGTPYRHEDIFAVILRDYAKEMRSRTSLAAPHKPDNSPPATPLDS